MKRFPLALGLAATLLVVGAAGFVIGLGYEGSCQSKYKYVNADFACGEEVLISKSSYAIFRQELVDFIESEKESERVNSVSIYFRDLIAGPAFGVNELEPFVPASLLKMPLAMTYLRLEEERSGILGLSIKYTKGASTQDQFFEPTKSLVEDEPYTIEEIIRRMVTYSDNISYKVLGDYLDKIPDGEQFAYQIYRELGIINPTNGAIENLTTQGYASIFRMLYNISFLDIAHSEKLLSWLAESDFDEGLAAGVPSDVKVANKFGERNFLNDHIAGKQLHDCGIIYYPGNPYVLCIMTQGNDFIELSKVVRDISKMVYDEVDSRRI